jgi:signal transduction histidine kinase
VKPRTVRGFFVALERRPLHRDAPELASLCLFLMQRMPSTTPRSSRVIFRVLALYVLFQFFWWAFHIIQLHGVIYELELATTDPTAHESLTLSFNRKVWMIVGEGLVFVVLLIFGIWRMGLYLRKEAELARQERNFMLAVTHELKTPVATLRLFLDTLRTRKQLDESRRDRIVVDALSETNRLDQLVENILLSTRFELNEMVHKEAVDLSELVERVAKKLANSIGSGHAFALNIENGLKVAGDPSLIESLLTNLLDNAVKYSPEGSTITVQLQCQAQWAVLVIGDEGAGIPESEQSKIFKKFYRVGNEETRKSKGTGLGLYLVNRIAQIHEGHAVASTSSVGGALLTIKIPRLQQEQEE